MTLDERLREVVDNIGILPVEISTLALVELEIASRNALDIREIEPLVDKYEKMIEIEKEN